MGDGKQAEGEDSGEETTSVDGDEDFLALPTENAEYEDGEGGSCAVGGEVSSFSRARAGGLLLAERAPPPSRQRRVVPLDGLFDPSTSLELGLGTQLAVVLRSKSAIDASSNGRKNGVHDTESGYAILSHLPTLMIVGISPLSKLQRAPEAAATAAGTPSPAVLATAFALTASGDSRKSGHGRGGGGGATGAGSHSNGGLEPRYYLDDGNGKAQGAAVTALTEHEVSMPPISVRHGVRNA